MRIILVLRFLLVFLCGGVRLVSAFRRFGIFSAAVTTSSAGTGNNSSAESSSSRSSLTRKNGRKRRERDTDEDEDEDWLDGLESQNLDGHGEDEYYRSVPLLDDNEETEIDGEEDYKLDDLQLHPMLEIPVSVTLTGVLHTPESPVRTFLDTGAMRTVMTCNMASKLGVLQHLDRRYAGQATGVGSCRVLGRLPAGLFTMHLTLSSSTNGQTVTLHSPAITILESSSSSLPEVELLLGLDFLREYKAVVDLRREEIRVLVKQQEHSIAFLRPKGSPVLNSSSRKRTRRKVEDEDEDDHDDEYEDDCDWDEHMRKSNYIKDSHLYDNELYDKRFLDEDEPTDYEDMPDMSGV